MENPSIVPIRPGADEALRRPSRPPEGARRVRPHPAGNGGSGDNQRLSRKRPREADELAAACRRLMRALARRAGSGDLQALVELRRLGPALQLSTAGAALAAHEDAGYSWGEIALALGITRQAARKLGGRE